MSFKLNDTVKYISGNYDDEISNPLWNGKFGKIKGIIIGIDFEDSNLPYQVKWDNGKYNDYDELDLELIEMEWDE